MFCLHKICLCLSEENRRQGNLFCEKNTKFEVTAAAADDAALYITDISSVAYALQKRGLPVLALLRAGEDLSGIRYAVETLEDLDETYLEGVYRRYRKIPWEIVSTPRCLVRETIPADAESFLTIYAGEGITDFLAHIRPTVEEERAHITDTLMKEYEFFGCGMWTILDKKTGEIIGRAGFSYAEDCDEPQLGYVIRREKQGQGLATEVCLAILAYARESLGFERVHIFVHPENAPSLAVAKKLGAAECKEQSMPVGNESGISDSTHDTIHFVVELS